MQFACFACKRVDEWKWFLRHLAGQGGHRAAVQKALTALAPGKEGGWLGTVRRAAGKQHRAGTTPAPGPGSAVSAVTRVAPLRLCNEGGAGPVPGGAAGSAAGGIADGAAGSASGAAGSVSGAAGGAAGGASGGNSAANNAAAAKSKPAAKGKPAARSEPAAKKPRTK